MKILIVDDEYLIRYSLLTLMEQEGYEVFAAASGQEGLHLFKERKPDIVVLDVRLPDMSGFALLKAIKEFSASTIVIMATGCPDERGSNEATRMGALDYLEKPVDIDTLKTLVHAARQQRSQGTGSGRRADSR